MNETPPLSKFNSAYVLVDRVRHTEEANQAEAQGLVRLVPMRPGERLLDACCGYGRHLVHFARLGLQVTGVEKSRAMFKEAMATLEESGARVQLECMPVEAMPYRRQFHHAVLLSNSFGYGTTAEDDVRVFTAIREALMARGRLILEASNPTSGEPWGDSHRVFKFPDMFVEEERKYLARHDLWMIRQVVHRGSWEDEWQMVIRRYDNPTLTSLLEGCGFEIERTWANLSGAFFTGVEDHMILCCRALR